MTPAAANIATKTCDFDTKEAQENNIRDRDIIAHRKNVQKLLHEND